MKKFVAVLSAAAMLATLAACGSTATTTSTATSSADTAKSYEIAVVQQLDHASLDEIRTAVKQSWTPKPPKRALPLSIKISTARTTLPR